MASAPSDSGAEILKKQITPNNTPTSILASELIFSLRHLSQLLLIEEGLLTLLAEGSHRLLIFSPKKWEQWWGRQTSSYKSLASLWAWKRALILTSTEEW